MTTTRAISLVFCLSALFFTQTASAHVTGAQDCADGYQPVLNYNTVDVPHYMANAQRGDILLSAGGNGVPRDIFLALGQLYNHIMIVSKGIDNSGNTLLTHDTAISPGEKTMDVGGVAPFKEDQLRRIIPGNIIGDTASTLVRGNDEGCLNTGEFADCGHARPKNIWHGANVLLRPSSQFFGQQDIVNAAEAHAPGSLLYAFGAYSNHLATYNATGHEASFGRGTMCSGFVAEAINDALISNGHHTHTIAPVTYNNAQREAAGVALHRRVYNDAYPLVQANPLNYVVSILGGINVVAGLVSRDMARQLVNCFAFGGACNNDSAWTNVTVMTHDFAANPTTHDSNLSSPHTNNLGTGDSLSPDNVLDAALNQGLVTQVNTTIMGGFSIQRFSHIMCCPPNVTSGAGCYRPQPTAVEAVSEREPYLVYNGEGDVVELGASLRDEISEQKGEFIEARENMCYVTQKGSVCTALPAEDEEPQTTNTADTAPVEYEEAEVRR